ISWRQASQSAGARTGESALFQIVLTVPPTVPNTLTGLNSFSLRIPCLDCNIPWPVAAAVQSYGPNGLLVSWPATSNAGGYRSQQSGALTRTHWVALSDPPILVGQNFQVTLAKPAGTMFYRLVWHPALSD